MAMRPRGGGVGPNRPNRAPRPAARPVYEDFRPLSERHQDEQAEKLLVYLPGFLKESIRVSTEGKNTVRVRGERFVGGNKWHRFQEDFQAPDDCNMRGIHAKFENGILFITMPFKMPKQSLDEPTKPPPLTTPPPQKNDNVPPKTKTSEPPRKPAPLEPTVQLPKPQNADKGQDSRVKEKQRDEKKILDGQLGSAGSSQTQKGDSVPPKTTYPTIEAPRKPTPLKPTAQLPKPQNAEKDQDSTGVKVKPRDEKKILDGQSGSAESSKTQKGDNVPPKTIYPTIEAPRKLTPLKPRAQLPKPQDADKDQDSRVQEKQRDEKKIFDDPLRSAESSKTQKDDEDKDFPALRKTPLGKTSGEKEKSRDEKKILESLAGIIEPKILKSKEENLNQNRTQLVKSGKEVEKDAHAAGGKKVAEMSKDLREDQENAGQKGSKEKESTSNVAAGTFSYPGSMGNLKKNLVELNEERQLLVNAGAAVLVIMALGVYVYHSIGSGRDGDSLHFLPATATGEIPLTV